MATDEKKTNAPVPASGADEVKQLKEELKQSKETVGDLTAKVSDLQGTIISPQYQEYMKTQNQPAPQTFQPTDFAAGRTGEVDLESMDRKEYSNYLLGEMDKRLGPRIDQVSQDTKRYQIDRDIKDVKGKYKDFETYDKLMGKDASRIINEGPTALDMYLIQKGRETVQSQKTEQKTEETKTEKPTTGGNAPTDTKQLTLAEKVSKKWDEAGIDEKFPTPKQ